MNERRWNRRFDFNGEKSKGSLTEGSVIKGFLLFALPLFLGSLFQQLYGTTDLIFVGNFMGKTEAAAVGASSILITCLIGLFTGISVGAGVITGNFQGAGEKERVRNSIENALAIAFFGGLFLTLLGQVMAGQALIWLNTPENIMKEALTYVRIYLMAVLSMILYNMCAGIFRALGDSRTPFLVLAAGGILNVGMDALFIASLHQGVAGAAAATLISQTFTAVVLLLLLFRREKLWKGKWKVTPEMLLLIIKTGVPLGIQSMILTISNIFVQYYINGFGENAIAAFTVYFKAENFLYLPIMAFGQAMVTFTSQNAGAGKYERIKKAEISCSLVAALIIGGLAALLLCIDRKFTGVFCKDPDVISIACQIIHITFPFYFVYSIMELTGSVVRGLKKTFLSMVIVIVDLCLVRVLLLAWSAAYFHSVSMVAMVYPVTWLLAMLSFLFCYRKSELFKTF